MENHKKNKESPNARLWAIVFIWILLALISVIFLPYAGKPFKIGEINSPYAESTIAKKTMEKEFPFGGTRMFVLYTSKKLKTNDAIFVSEVKKSLSGLTKLSFDYRISSPYQNTSQISSDGHEAYAVIRTNSTAEELANNIYEIQRALGKPKTLNIYIGGEPSYTADVYRLSEVNLIRGELISLPICFIAMVFIFGGFIAALVTILSGVISIVIIIGTLYLLGHQMDLTVFVLNIATMLGLGLSLDYTLLLTYRFKEEFKACHDCVSSINNTLGTAGKSIFFSGLIVLISIGSLIFFPINILFSIGVAGIVVVVITILCSLTFLPSLLCLLERNVTRTIPQLKKISSEHIQHHRWYKFAMLVMRYPILFLIPTIFVLLMLGYPFLHVKLNSADAKILPSWVESRQLLDQFNENFDPHELNPITILFKAKNDSILTKENIGALYDYVQKLKKDSRIKSVQSIVTIKPNLTKQQYQKIYQSTNLPFNEYDKEFFNETTKGPYTVMSIISKFSREDKKNFDLIRAIRTNSISNDITKQVTGSSAQIIDTIQTVYTQFFKLLILISIVTYLSLVWLLRSLILPLKAIIMNFLSLSVCYGMLVFIFQEGHFSQFLGFKPLGFTDMHLPILLFFTLFGLSMDYEIFLLTRIKEYYEKTQNNTKSVAMGLERSARIITSAALIVVIVSGAFVTADIVFIKAFGLGTALAIAVDASLIRLLLVPATMKLLGNWNWYIPKWLDRILPNIMFDREPVVCKIPKKRAKSRD